MRTLILALTAVTAFTAGGVLVGSTEPGAPTDPIQKRQMGLITASLEATLTASLEAT